MTRVLIVDDQPAFRRQLSQMLAYVGLEVVAQAGAISEAEQLALQHHPDLAIVDVMLPGINGIVGTPRLKAAAPQMRVILVSAFADQSAVFHRAAGDAGADGFVLKDDLDIDLIRKWL